MSSMVASLKNAPGSVSAENLTSNVIILVSSQAK